MKFLIIGLGSMGKRRIRNLQSLGEKDIIGFDLKEERRKEAEQKYNIKTFGTIGDALADNPNVFIISTPPDHHIEYEILAAELSKPFFCEAGIFTDRLPELIKLCKKNKVLAAPSCTFRFLDSICKIKELVDTGKIGKVIALTHHQGHYLPNWHPWEELSSYYAGQRNTSGTREMVPFEMQWLTWIFGEVKELSCIKGKVSSLPVDVDDVYQIIFQLKSGAIGNLLIEGISGTPARLLQVVGEEGTIELDWMSDLVKYYDAKTKTWTEFKEEKGFKEQDYIPKENMYIKEIHHFLNAINKKEKYTYTLEDDFKTLNLLQAAEKAANEKKQVIFNE